MLYTNLKLLKEQSACSSGLARLIASLPPNYPEDKSISLAHILESNGLNHALWALRSTTVDSRKIAARMAIEFAFQVLNNFEKRFPKDKRPRTALEQAVAFLDGKITLKELKEAVEAVGAVEAAWATAWTAEEAAAWEAARAAEAARAVEAAEATARAARAAEAARAARATARAAMAANEKIFKKWISQTR